MKIYSFNFKSKKGLSRKELHGRLEKSLMVSVMLIFLLLIVIQAAMINPGMRDYLSTNMVFDGEALEADEMLFDEGSVTLELIGQENNESLIVLLNGDEIAAFNSRVVSVSVKDGDILEIDGSATQLESEIEIVTQSPNIHPVLSGSRIHIGSEIKKVLQVKMQ